MLTDERMAEIRESLLWAQQVRHTNLCVSMLVEVYVRELLDEIDALRAERDKLLLELVP